MSLINYLILKFNSPDPPVLPSLRYLDLIPFDSDHAAFVVSVAGCSWAADHFKSG